MRKVIFYLLYCVFSISIYSQASSAGDIMFVAFNSDGDDAFSFVTLVDLPDGTTINFSENAWDGSAFSGSEAEFQWENNTGSTIGAGKVITISNLGVPTATIGIASKISGTGNLANSGEVIYAYTGSEASPGTFLSSLANSGFVGTDLSNTGLVDGTTAIDLSKIDTGADVANYIGTTVFNGTKDEVYTTIATVNGTNWETWDASGDQSANYNPPPDFTGSALPVELTLFTANMFDGKVNLRWATATEVDNYGFEIERQKLGDRSKEAEAKWNNIGFVEGHGNSNSPKEYTFTDEITAPGKYSYRLKQIDTDGSFEYSGTVTVSAEDIIPDKFDLFQNYPNPFNPVTKIKYSIPAVIASEAKQSVHATLKVYDIIGREVAVLVNESKEAGIYEVEFDASKLSSGLYFYSLNASGKTITKKMMLLR